MNSSLSFLVAQRGFSFSVTIAVTGPTPRALTGQTETQRMHEIHASRFKLLRLSAGMASAGHNLLQAPQPVQLSSAVGKGPEPAAG